jgi:hypothetical protein
MIDGRFHVATSGVFLFLSKFSFLFFRLMINTLLSLFLFCV